MSAAVRREPVRGVDEGFVASVVLLLFDAADRHDLAGRHALAQAHRARAGDLLAAIGV